MTLLVLGQVIAAHKCFLAEGADVLLLASMRASMPTEFVRSSERFVAAGPRAQEWLLTWKSKRESDERRTNRTELTRMQTNVRLEMR